MKRTAHFTILALVLALGACATLQQYQAADGIRAFLLAIRDTDQAAFDAHIDRPALKAQLRERLIAASLRSDSPLGALEVQLAGPLVDFAVDKLAQPEVFLAVARAEGYSPDKPIPDAMLLARLVKTMGADRACVTTKPGGPCVLVFRNEAGVWKLIAFEGDPKLLRLR